MSSIQCIRGTAQNFSSVGNTPVTINYLDLGNLTLVHSELNGSGKSTLFVKLMIYALKGKAYNNKSKVGNLVNLKNNKRCVVEFEFKHGSDTYIIRRGQKPKIFELYKNGDLLDTAIDYQKQLNTLIGSDVSFDMLVNTIILSNSRYTPFRMQTKKQREEFLDHIFRTHVYNPMVFENKKDIKGLTESIELINIDINKYEMLLTAKKSAIDEFNKTKDSISNELKDNVSSLTTKAKEVQGERESLCDNSTKLQVINDEIAKLTASRQEVSNSINQLMLEQQKKMVILKIDTCESCHQTVSPDRKSVIKLDIKEQLKSIEPLKIKLSEFDDKLLILNNKRDIEAKLYNEYIISKSRLDAQLTEITGQIKTYYTQIKTQDSTFKNTIDEYKLEINNLNISLNDLNKKLSKLLKELDVSTLASEFLTEVNLRKEIMSKYIPYINDMLNQYLKEMEFFIEVILDDNYDIVVSSFSKEGLNIHDLSDGERSKIDLAFILVWKNIQDKITQDVIDIFILDETLATFSPQSVKDFLRLIRKVLPNHKVVVILQHPNDFIESFDSIIELKLENDFTYIENQDISLNDTNLTNIF